MSIAENIAAVRQQMDQAARETGRTGADIMGQGPGHLRRSVDLIRGKAAFGGLAADVHLQQDILAGRPLPPVLTPWGKTGSRR